ncbi:PH domain-containing protein [Pseudonocardia bannensis]|uniref:PH domain-containing protein n=1 Tax=Pseudonocardia bannensis TaxID=630973 RepID=A0A848DJX4_9PSEU|nr:PH domain-containing protein [Pseudonocardia bannensis]NMH92865.1 PH domain-containing protein [Pseudonocardia bannensis]
MSAVEPEPDPAAQQPPRAVFRVSPLGIFAAIALAFFAVPFAFGAPWLWLIYLVPVGIVVWILRVRTVADRESVTVRGILRSRRVPWSEISSLRLQPSTRARATRVSAVLTEGGELLLPAVHVRDLSQLAAVSGGRLPDPAGE